jgi:peptidoglycan hydrolase-like protein with peptidoglycan-binding domain
MRTRAFVTGLVVAAVLAVPTAANAGVNPQIAGLQVALRAWGFYHGAIDGIAGPQTSSAVRRFQRRAGLTVDGIAGPRTRRALGRVGRPLFGRRMLHRGAVGWDVAVLQFLLRRRGASPGIVDGYFGPETRRAVRRFQRRVRLAVDGIAGPHTLARLGAPRLGGAPNAISVHAASRSYVRRSINRWSRHYGVSAPLARALAWMESGFQTNAVSPVGAWGVMQITPATWDYVETVLLGRNVPHTTDGNVRVGVAYLHHLLHEFDWNERRALAAYYAGPAAIHRWGIGPQSRPFVRNVLALKGRV